MTNKNTTIKGKILTGKIVSTKMEKSVAVEVENVTRHKLYRKPMKHTKKYIAHNELTGLVEGDVVRIGEIKPMSRRIHMTIIEKVV